MPRIRSLKPEHRQHRKVGPLSDRCYRLWQSMISEADDEGRLICDAGQLRVVTWPYYPKVTVAHVEAAIQCIAETGLIRLYFVDEIRYAWFPSWNDHQKPKYPTESKLPECPISPSNAKYSDSPSVPPAFPQSSPSVPPAFPVGLGLEVLGWIEKIKKPLTLT